MNLSKTLAQGLFLAGISLGLSACVTDGNKINKFKELSSKERKEEEAKIKTQLAIEYVNARDYRAAVATIEEAVQANSSYDMAWLVRAQVYQFLKTYDKAEQSFARALSISPNGAEINNNYGWYLCSVRNQPALSIAYFDRAIADPTYPTPEIAYYNKAICTAKAGQSHMADAYFERSLSMNPDFFPVYKEQARIKLETGQVSEADRLFRIYQSKVQALTPDDLLLGWKIARAKGESQNAAEYAEQLRINFPHSDEFKSLTGN